MYHIYRRYNTLKVVGASIQQFIPMQPCIMHWAHVRAVGMHVAKHTIVTYYIHS